MAYPTGWNRRCEIVIDHTKVTANQTAFPVLLIASNFPNEMVTTGGGNAAQSDGGDIRFSTDTAGASRLACEIVTFVQNATPSLATAEIYVPVTISSSVDTSIYVWYNAGGGQTQPAANAAFGSQAVWDSSTSAVFHLPDVTGGAGSVVDSKTGTTGTPTNTPSNATGKIGNAGSFATASSEEVTFSSNSYLDFTSSDFTWEAWIKPPNANQGSPVFGKQKLTSAFNGWHMGIGSRNSSGVAVSSKKVYSFVYAGALNSSAAQFYHTTNDVVDGNWHHMVVTRFFDGVGRIISIYIDGTSVALTADIASTVGVSPTNTGTFRIGTNGATYYEGLLDEIRISVTTCRSATWISTSYNSTNDPATFSAAGTPLPVGGVVTQPIMRFIN